MDPDLVAPGVERLALRTPTLPPATHTNCYLVGTSPFYVVEPASPYAAERDTLLGVVRARIARGDRPAASLLTHHHADHVGAADALRRELGIPVAAHPATRDKLAGRIEIDRQVLEGDADLAALGIDVLHTPGHAPGHVCLFSRAHRWLIAGDMVASVGTILIDPDDDGDMDAYLTQLERLAALEPRRILPAHGEPIDDAVGRLRFYVAHRLGREAKVLAAVGAEPTALGAIVARAYDDTPVTLWPLAMKSARAHLARLVQHGSVTVGATGDMWRRAASKDV